MESRRAGRIAVRLAWLALLSGVCLLMLLAGLLWCPFVVRADEAVNGSLAPYRAQPLLDAVIWLTAFAANPAIVAVCVTATGFLGVARLSHLILPLWVAFLGGQFTSWILKHLVGRSRPEFLEIASATSPSFPSGHSISAMAVYGFLAYVLAAHRPAGWLALVAPIACSALIPLIGFSRMFLSLHYASDVLGGFLVGAFWLLVAISLSKRNSP